MKGNIPFLCHSSNSKLPENNMMECGWYIGFHSFLAILQIFFAIIVLLIMLLGIGFPNFSIFIVTFQTVDDGHKGGWQWQW